MSPQPLHRRRTLWLVGGLLLGLAGCDRKPLQPENPTLPDKPLPKTDPLVPEVPTPAPSR